MDKIEDAFKEFGTQINKDILKSHDIEYCCNCHKYTKWDYCIPMSDEYSIKGCSVCNMDRERVRYFRMLNIRRIRKERRKNDKRNKQRIKSFIRKNRAI